MKKFKIFTLSAVMGLLMTANVFAQGRTNDPEERAKRQTEKLKSQLSLNDEQASAIEQINLERSNKINALRAEKSEGRQKSADQMREIHQAWDTQVMAVLNPDQKVKYEELKADRAEKMRERSGERNNRPYKSKRGDQTE